MSKTPQTIIVKKKPANKQTYRPDPNCFFSWKKTPISRSLIERMIEELPDWVEKNPEKNSLTEFYFGYHIAKQTRQGLLERHADLKEAHDIAMTRLGERMYDRSVLRQYDWNAVKFRIHRYDPEYLEDKNVEAEMRAKAGVQDQIQKVTIDYDTMALTK